MVRLDAMSPRNCRRLLWAASVLLMPVPFYLIEAGFAPVARIVLLTIVTGSIVVVEGTRGAVGVAAAMMALHAVAYLLVLWAICGLIVRGFAAVSARHLTAITLSTIALATLLAATTNLYETPFRRDALRSNLFHVFD